MDPLLGLMIGIGVGLGYAIGTKWLRSRERFADAQQAVSNSPVTTNYGGQSGSSTDQPVVNPSEEPIGTKLRRLEDELEQFANSAVHPRDCLEHQAFKDARAMLADDSTDLDTVLSYALSGRWQLSAVAVAALTLRKDKAEAVESVLLQFDKLSPWAMYFAFELFLAADARPAAGAPFVNAKDWWRENILIAQSVKEYFVKLQALGDAPKFGDAASRLPTDTSPIHSFLEGVRHPFAQALADELKSISKGRSDKQFLTTFGRFWESGKHQLIEPEEWHEAIELIETALAQSPPRSVLVTGEASTGKTSLLRLLAERVESKGWGIFEASGMDLMAGQQWFGQLEDRIRRTTEEVSAEKKLIWYIPDLLQFARSGMHQGQSASILDQILPAVTAGKVVIWTEAGPTAASRLYMTRPTLRSLFETVRLEPMDEDQTETLAQQLCRRISDKTGLAISEDCVPLALNAARQYMPSAALPGAALTLLKLTIQRAEGDALSVEPADVWETLSQVTGLPVSILDGSERIDLATIRAFFSSRIIGQDEAVASIVERIAMLKAGLNDPGKPVGVFLCAGPTGTGKTELAKTTAEFLFGSPERMIRLDMSEFQTAEAVTKIIGDGMSGEAETLISRVRKQPFSVVLLDEFEKSHPRIWDLFLQVFDDGRLSDAMGQVADFRHCIIILTSNLGATSHQSSGLGFAPSQDAFSPEQVIRAITQTYRPEFLNRLDKIVVFRPLTRDLMRGILMKELSRVLERRGLRDRDWAIEWESSALEFLLAKGFTAELGARPLKRAVDQYVLAPLAATIVERRFPEGDQFVFVRSDGKAIQAEFVDPDADEDATGQTAADVPEISEGDQLPSLREMIAAPSGTSREATVLREKLSQIENELAGETWEDLRLQLSLAMSKTGFWSDPTRFDTLSRIALIDRVSAASATGASLAARLNRAGTRTVAVSKELVSRLALQLYLVEAGIRDAYERSAIEVALHIEPALEPAGSSRRAISEWCDELFTMYRSWAGKRNMQFDEVSIGGKANIKALIIAGFGAERVLSREAGLHVFEANEAANGAGRLTARVRIAPTLLGDYSPQEFLHRCGAAIQSSAKSAAVVRRYRRDPSPLVRDATGAVRSGKLDAVLAGDFDLLLPSSVASREF